MGQKSVNYTLTIVNTLDQLWQDWKPKNNWKEKLSDFVSSDLNAKGCVHQAFEVYRLKSCVDFKPYEGEKSYIKFEKQGGWDTVVITTKNEINLPFTWIQGYPTLGSTIFISYHFFCHRCFSSVGKQSDGQILSLGPGCDHKAVIEHELLHALGFYHEQSRTDRDDYVNIWLDQVKPGMCRNCTKYERRIIGLKDRHPSGFSGTTCSWIYELVNRVPHGRLHEKHVGL